MSNRTTLEDGERRIVATIFVWGVSLSVLAMVAGFVLSISNENQTIGTIDLSHLEEMTLAGALMTGGIGILTATPVANVIALLILWIRHRRLTLVTTAASVLVTLTLALLLGRS